MNVALYTLDVVRATQLGVLRALKGIVLIDDLLLSKVKAEVF
jgi:hypothetical protein